jgi:hypothetical protein
MSDRERVRRPEPARTAPVRNVSGVLRGEDGPAADPAPPGPASSPGPAAPGHAPPGHAPNNPFAWPGDDPVGRAVRAGRDVVESAVRRGFGLGRDPSSGAPPAPPWASGLPGGPWSTGAWSTGQWIDAVTGVITQWVQWMDTWAAKARSVMAGGAEWPGPWPAALARLTAPPTSSSSATSAPGALRLTLELRTARAISVQLDLAPGGTTALEIHGLLAPAAAAAPPITDVRLAVADGGVTLSLGSIDQHPAGTYAGAVLAAGRACGTLTVQLT